MKIHLMRLMATALFVLFPLVASAGLGPLIDAQSLKQELSSSETLVLDIRVGMVEGATIFEGGHVPGAIHAPYKAFRGPKTNPGQLVSETALTDLLRSLGVEVNRPTVIVYQGTNASDFGSAARVYWTLKSSGVQDIAILNGGVNAWVAAGFELEKGLDAWVEPSDITVSFSDQWLATTQDVAAIVKGEQSGELIDARPVEFWEGNRKHPAATKPGTLPQSRYFVQSSWFNAKAPSLIDASAVPELAVSGGFKAGDRLVSFCNTGHWAATNWFALSELAGFENVKLYAESMVGWSQSNGEMENVPGSLRNLWNKVRGHY